MALTRHLTVMGITSVVWRPRKNKTALGQRTTTSHACKNTSLQTPKKLPPRLPISQNQNLRSTSPQGQQGPRRPGRQINSERGNSNHRENIERGKETDGRTNTDNKGCRLLAAGNLKQIISPHTKEKSNKNGRGPQPQRRSNRGTIGTPQRVRPGPLFAETSALPRELIRIRRRAPASSAE